MAMLKNAKRNGGRIVILLLVLVLVLQMVPAATLAAGEGTISPNVTVESRILYGGAISTTDHIPAGSPFTVEFEYSFLPLGTDQSGTPLVYEYPTITMEVPKGAVIDKIIYDNNTDIDQSRLPGELPSVPTAPTKNIQFYLNPGLAGDKKQVSVLMHFPNMTTPNNTACAIKSSLDGSITANGVIAGTFSVAAQTKNLNITASEPWTLTKEAGSMAADWRPSGYKLNTIEKVGDAYRATYRLSVKENIDYDRMGRLDFLTYALTDIFPTGYPAGGGGRLVDVRMKDPGQNDATVVLAQGTDYDVTAAVDGSTKSITIKSYAQQPKDGSNIPKGAPVESVYYVTVDYPAAPYIYATNADPEDHIYSLQNTAQLSYKLVGEVAGNSEANASIKLGEVEQMKTAYTFAIAKYIRIGEAPNQYYSLLDENAQAAYGTAQFWLTMDAEGRIPARNIYNQPVMQTVTDIGADGRLVFTDMREGDYYLSEYKAPNGFGGLSGRLKITVNPDGSVTRGDTGERIANPATTDIKIDNTMTDSGLGIVEFTKMGKDPAGRIIPMPGVTFELISGAGQAVQTAITDKNGYIAFHAVPAGNYKIKETSISTEMRNAGFEVGTPPLTLDVTVEENRITKVVSPGESSVMNYSPYGTLNIKKTDASGNRLTGPGVTAAEFTLYEADQTTVARGMDSTNYSRIVVPNTAAGYVSGLLPAGTYYLKETKAPNGYELRDDFIEVTITGSTTTTASVKNNALAKLGVLKYGAWGGVNNYVGLAGVSFRIYDVETGGSPLTNEKGEVIVLTSVTDATGKPTLYDQNNNDTTAIKVLPVGSAPKTYYLEEVEAPDGYTKLTDRIAVTMQPGQVTTVDVYNTPDFGRIQVEKKNERTGAAMSGVEFTFYNGDATYSEDANGNPTAQPVYKTVTDSAGIATSMLLAPGKNYYIAEKTPTGFKPAGGVYKSMLASGELSTAAPDGATYLPITAPVAGTSLKVTVKNEPLVGLQFVKTESTKKNTSTVTISGVTFELYTKNPDGLSAAEKTAVRVGRGTTGSGGLLTFGNLEPGRSYWYVEVSAPAGYFYDATPKEVTAPTTAETTPKKVEVTNDRAATLKIKKTGKYNYGDGSGEKDVVLSGATFEVFPKLSENWRTDYAVAGSETRADYKVKTTNATDNNGIVLLPNIKPGFDYWILEKQAPAGYAKGTEAVQTTDTPLSGDNVSGYNRDVTHATVDNMPEKGILKIKKVNAANKNQGLAATFKLYPEDPAGSGLYPTNGAGVVTITTAAGTGAASGVGTSPWLAPGKYKLVETAVTGNYSVDPAERIVTINAGETLDLTLNAADHFLNAPLGRVKITKTTTWKGVAQGSADFTEKLSGAVFEVFPNLTGNAADDRAAAAGNGTLKGGLTTAAGEVYSPYMKPGDYWVHETAAPSADYVKDDNYYSVTVPGNNANPANNIADVSVDNKPNTGRIRISKVEMGTNLPLNDAYFELYEVVAAGGTLIEVEPGVSVRLARVPNTGNIVSGTELNANGQRIAGRVVTIPLNKDKTYYLRETRVPGGYQMVKEWTGPITVTAGNVTQQVVENFNPQTAEVGKVDSHGNAVSGAYFGLFDNEGDAIRANEVIAANAAAIESATTDAQLLDEGFWNSLGSESMNVLQVQKSANGSIQFENIAPQTHWVVELKAAAGYTRRSDIKELVYDLDTETFKPISFINDEYGYIQVSKYTELSGTYYRLDGATFGIFKAKLKNPDAPSSDNGGDVNGGACDYEIDGTAIHEFVTGTGADPGAFVTGRIPSGHYIVKETAAPDGFTASADAYHVYVAPGEINMDLYVPQSEVGTNPNGKIIIENTPNVGRFELSKKDAHTGALIAATFKIEKKNGDAWEPYTSAAYPAGTFTTAAGQVYLSEFMEPGEYRIIETNVDGSYTLDAAPIEFEITAGVVTRGLEKLNVKKGGLRFTKGTLFGGSEKGTLAGAKFELYAVQGGDPAGPTLTAGERTAILARPADATATANAQGVVSFTGLNANELNGAAYSKDYWLIEVDAGNAGYNPAGFTPRRVTIRANDTVNLDTTDPVVNIPEWGKLRIHKVDANAVSTGLAGARFTVHKQESCADTEVATITTDANGYAQTGLIEPGQYWLKEVTTPAGYTTVAANSIYGPYTVEANKYNDPAANVIGNIKQQKIVVTKVSDAAGKPAVAGVTFDLYKGDPSSGGTKVATLTTGSDGKVTFENLLPNTDYWLVETAAPDTIVLNTTPVKVSTNNTGTVTKTIENTRKGKIAVSKVARYFDAATGGYLDQALSDIFFDIHKTTGNNGSVGSFVEKIGTSDGYAVSGWLAPGWYVLTEQPDSPGLGDTYEASTQNYYVELTSGETDTTLSENPVVNDAKKGRFRVEKFAQTGGQKTMLPNAEFALFMKNKSTGLYEPVQIGTTNIFRTEADGTYLSGPLAQGDYMFKETSAPVLKDGAGKIIAEYTLDEQAEYTFTIKNNEVVTLSVENFAKASLLLTKKADSLNGSVNLNGAVFQLYDKNTNQPVGARMVTGTDGVATGDGTILWTGLDAGKYYVREVTAPEGYQANVQTIDIDVSRLGAPYQYTITASNTSVKGRILIQKTDADTEAPLAGARFEVYRDIGGAPAQTPVNGVSFTSDATGFALSPLVDAAAGGTDYWVKETRAPSGYILDENLQPIWQKVRVYPLHTPAAPATGETGRNYLAFKNTKPESLDGFASEIVKTVKRTGGAVDPASPYSIDTDKFEHGLMQGDVRLTFGLQGYAKGKNPLPYKTFSVTDMRVGMQYKETSGDYVAQPIAAGDYSVDKVKLFAATNKDGSPVGATVQYQTYAQLGTNQWSSFAAGSVENLQNLPVTGVLGYETVDLQNLPNGDIAMAVRVNYRNMGTGFTAYGIDMDVTFKQREGGALVHEIQRLNNYGSISYSYELFDSTGADPAVITVPSISSNEAYAFLPTQDVVKTVVEVTNKITKPTENHVFYPGRDMGITTTVSNKSATIPYNAPEVAIDLPAWTILKNATNPDAVIVTLRDKDTGTNRDLVQGTDYFVRMDEYVQATTYEAGILKPIFEADGVTPVMVRRMSFVFPDIVLDPDDSILFLYEATVSARLPYYVESLTSNAYASSGYKLPVTVENPLGVSYREAPGMGSMRTDTDLDAVMDGLFTQANKDKPGENMYIHAYDQATVGVSNDLSVRKEVKGPQDADFKDPGDAAYVLPGAEYEYRLTITNNSNIEVEKLRFVDILPFLGDTYVVRNPQNDSLNARKTELPARPTVVDVVPDTTNGAAASVYYYEDATGTRWTVEGRRQYTPMTDLPMLYLQDTGEWASNGWIGKGSETNIDDVTAVGIDVVFSDGAYLAANGGTYSVVLKMKAPGFSAGEVMEYYNKMLSNSAGVSILQTGGADDVNFPTPIENNEVISYMSLPTGTIGNYVFWDKDNDGLQTQDASVNKADPDNAVENPLGGVGVTLYQYKYTAGQSGFETTEYKTQTDSNGYYEFTGLSCNLVTNPEYEGSENPEHYVGGVYYRYELLFEQPSVGENLLGPTHMKIGGDPSTDSDVDLNYRIGNILLRLTEKDGVLVGEANNTLDAGFTRTAALGDRVWFDTNKNGIQDEDEAGVNGVTVNLYRVISGTVEDKVYRTAETAAGKDEAGRDADGLYLFSDLVPGEYVIEFDIAGLTKEDGYTYQYMFTNPLQGVTGEDDSDAVKGNPPVHADDRIRRTRTITLPAQKTDRTWDAGLTTYSAVGGNVFDDVNYSHTQDIGIPLEGTQVILYRYDDSGAPVEVARQTVDASGAYLFDFLSGGDYAVYFKFPEGYEAVNYSGAYIPEHVGSEVGFNFDENRNGGWTERFTLGEDEVQPYWDAGAFRYGALGDAVWFDANKNGLQDEGEKPAEGVRVTLQRRYGPDGIWEFYRETVTDARGAYLFDQLESGLDANWQYRVVFLPEDGYEMTKVMTGANGAVDSDATHALIDGWGYPTNAVLLEYGQRDMSWDAGLVNVTAAIGDLIWFDNNRNGVQDRDTEAGVDGVLVVLEYAADNTAEDPAEWGWREIAYEVTSNGGHYDFLDLKKGYYRLNFYLPQTYEVTMLESEEAIEAVGESMAYKFDSDAIPVEEKTVFTDGHAVQPASGGIAAGVMAEGIANFSAAETGITIDPQDWAKVNYPDGYRHLTRMVELQEEKSDWSWDAGIYQPRDAGTSYEYREGEVITRTYGDGTGVNGMSSRGDVRTGDESVLWLWIALAAGAGVVIALTLRARRRAYGRRH